MLSIQKVLFPTDFSETSHAAMRYAIDFARQYKATLRVVHVMFDETQSAAFYLPQVTLTSIGDELESAAAEQLKNLLENNPLFEGITVERALLKGTPYAEIVTEAEAWGADIIVIGTHGRSGIDHVLFGSTAERVVRKAGCPVLTVRR